MEKNPTYLFVAAAALVDEKGRILVQKRPEGKPMAGLWEFPGGKVESGETPEIALIRELREELNISVEPQDIEPLAFASEPLAEKHLILLLYICRRWTGQVESPEALDLQWLPVTEIDGLPMPPADGPLVQMLSNHLLAPA
ncbi:(deoxy)nucleoside triphosphate pyrophosphohydrolase [Parasphingorhabdus flavimaris]|uniref:8-oxo-dGTP diphosphatase n=1 Tax=Parasphingorhabdus flavimaris TaxID=266812 RepID=A0ABX2MZ78_9SPHN|nr:(deoxy)nucleoside triphosphate pyrophosphohydrolase [Parasphingorhabdus flavimaris]NVD26767.1 (deoxy)nucleoside triphosphate pyrophosphohydrolase [Parasphingorhabdus flavimaris]|tara:strand:+ start:12906 stop:13328 length:423 start_codon:yes stop_codon:yes gene_type:complete